MGVGCNRRADRIRCAWTGAGALQWMKVEHQRPRGRSRSQSWSWRKFGGSFRSYKSLGLDWRWSVSLIQAEGCCRHRGSVFSTWSSCSETRFWPGFRSDSRRGPGSVSHTRTNTASCGICFPEPPAARRWRLFWRAAVWRRPDPAAAACGWMRPARGWQPLFQVHPSQDKAPGEQVGWGGGDPGTLQDDPLQVLELQKESQLQLLRTELFHFLGIFYDYLLDLVKVSTLNITTGGAGGQLLTHMRA